MTTAWNEFSSTIASAIIYLATNQKFHFSKYIFESMVKNLDNVGKFFMYPRFVQVFLDKQLEGTQSHKRIYDAPSHTKKIFGNMKRVGKGFSGRETPLFPTMVVKIQAEIGEGSTIPTNPHHTPIQPSTSQPQKKQGSRRPKRKDTEILQSSGLIDNVADETVNEEMDDSLVRAATTASSLEAEQDSGNIDKTESKATPNEPSSSGTSSGGGPRRQETMGDTIAQTRSENVSKLSNDPLLARGNTLQSCKDSLKLEELMAFCTTLQTRVLASETIKTTQANEIDSLKRRVKRLEKKDRKRTHKLKRLYKGRIADIDANKDIYLVNVQTDEDMFGVNDLDGDEVIVDNVDAVEDTVVIEKAKLVSAAEETVNVAAPTVSTASTILVTDVEITLAQALAELKSAKHKADKVVIQDPEQGTTTPTLTTTTATAASIRPRAKGIVFHEQEQAPTPTVSSQQPSQVKAQDKGKGIMVEEPVVEQVKPIKRLEQIRLDEELAFKLQAEEEEEERLAKEKAQQVKEANIAWDDV
ncbi:hypothetical protein Tco_1318035 [Tanacetum coccineum]